MPDLNSAQLAAPSGEGLPNPRFLRTTLVLALMGINRPHLSILPEVTTDPDEALVRAWLRHSEGPDRLTNLERICGVLYDAENGAVYNLPAEVHYVAISQWVLNAWIRTQPVTMPDGRASTPVGVSCICTATDSNVFQALTAPYIITRSILRELRMDDVALHHPRAGAALRSAMPVCDECADISDEALVPFYPSSCLNGSSVRRGAERHMICGDCADDTVFVEEFEASIPRHYAENYLYWHEASEEWRTYEPESYEDEDDGYADRLILSYGTDILQSLGWPSATPQDALAFGVELEMEPKGDAVQRTVCRHLGGPRTSTYILKEDGSLDSGVELVTLPFTLAHHQTRFGWANILTPALRQIAQSGAGTTNCGMHVHASRAALSPLQIGKALVFLNSPKNAAFVDTIAQRRNSGYARRDVSKKLTDIHCGTRYDLLNVSGDATIEFRLFRGNLRPERVLKNLEFCHALLLFARDAGIKQSARWENLVAWIARHRDQYPNLVAFLDSHGYPVAVTPTRAAAIADADVDC